MSDTSSLPVPQSSKKRKGCLWVAAIYMTLFMAVIATFVIGSLIFFKPHATQMRAGQKYMDSLTTEDIQQWIERSKDFWSKPTRWYFKDSIEVNEEVATLPEDLEKLKILHVYVSENSVIYVWLGGFDHTHLLVSRDNAGQITVWANYSDSRSKKLWPISESL